MSVIVSRQTQRLIVPRNNASAIMFPDAPALEEGLVVPHDVRSMVLLRKLGYTVPNPMLAYYDWAGGKPFDVQRKTCALLTSEPRAYVLNDMGTGKTRAALWAWDYLHGNSLCGKLLVVAPLSTLNFVWAREVFATVPHRKAVVLHGNKKQRLERLADPEADIFIINHDGLKVIQKELTARKDIDVLVLDELAVYRNQSQRSKAMRSFAQRFTWLWGMTGSPMPNEPTDVWAQAKIITPSAVPKYFTHARDMLMTKVAEHIWKPKPNAVDMAYNMLKPSVRYSLDDVVELPEFIERTIDVELSTEQKKAYEALTKEFVAMIQDKQITAVNAGAAMSKLLQVSCGWVYTGDGKSVRLDSTPRLMAMLDLIASAAHKVIVFVPFRHTIEGIATLLTPADGKPSEIPFAVVHGDTKNRDDIFNKFQNTDVYHLLLAHPECVAHGLTLTAADTIIWYAPTASLEIYEQANARIRRVGQKHKQQFLHLQSTPVERKLYGLLRGKQKTQNQLLSMLEEASQWRTWE